LHWDKIFGFGGKTDAGSIKVHLRDASIIAVIPPRKYRKEQQPCDEALYKRLHLAGKCLCVS